MSIVLFVVVLLRVTITVTKHHDQKQLWRIGSFGLHNLNHNSLREIKAGSQTQQESGESQELVQKPWRTASWLAPGGLLRLLSYSTQSLQLVVTSPTMAWAFLYQSLIKKMPWSLACNQSYGGIFLSEVPPFEMTQLMSI